MSDEPTGAGRRQRLLEGSRFDVDRVAVPSREGGTVWREVVVHPGSVVVLPLLDPSSVVMIRNHRFSVDDTLWELCAGTLERGEDPLGCARRELAEETGYRAGALWPLCRFYPAPGISDELMHAFVATDLLLGAPELEPTERIDTEIVALAELEAMIGDGRVMDGKTVAVLLYWLRFGHGFVEALPPT
jgi:ADP-ribose pyrophosphatase